MSQHRQTVFFEDFKIGQEDHFGRYEVTRDEVIDFARRYDPQPFMWMMKRRDPHYLGGYALRAGIHAP